MNNKKLFPCKLIVSVVSTLRPVINQKDSLINEDYLGEHFNN